MSPERGSSSDRTLREKNDDDVGNNDQSKNQDKDEEKSEEEIEKEKQDKEDDAEKKAGGGSPLPVGFWDPKLKKVRMEVIKKWCLTTVLLMTFILGIMSLYWGVLFRVPQNMKNLKVAVVDFDGRSAPYTNVQPVVGTAVLQATRKLQQGPSLNQLGWTIVDPAQFNYDAIAVRQAVYDEKYWAAIIVNNNATALLEQAVAQGNQSYDPLGAMQTVYIQARDESTYSNYIVPMLNQFQTQIQSQFGQQWISQVLSNSAYSANTYNQVPQALNPAVGFSVFNLRPFQPATATPAVSIGLIYLIIISFFSFSFYLPIHSKFIMPQGHPPMHFWEMCIWRICATLLAYFFLSLAYSLVSLAFQIPFSNTFYHNDVTVAVAPDAYGRGSFVVYWMVNWLGMVALGLSSENVTMIIGQPWTALWLIFWVISNVSTSFYAEALSPAFFNWGYAWPLYHVVMASRTIIFDIHSKIGLNVGVLCAWSALNIALFFPCCVFMRWKTNKEMARKVPRSTIRYLVYG